MRCNVKLEWMSPEQAAEIWGITKRQVQSLCKQGKVDGIARLGHAWLIPKDAPRPADGRKKEFKEAVKAKK